MPTDPDQSAVNKTHRFVVGMSRAGTTWITAELSRHPQVIAFGETMLLGRMYTEPDRPDGTDSPQAAARRLELAAQHFEDYIAHAKDPTKQDRYKSSKLGHIPVDALEAISAELRKRSKECDSPATPADALRLTSEIVSTHMGKPIAIESTPNHLNMLPRILRFFPEARIVAMLRGPYAFMISYKHQGDRKEPEVQQTFRKLYHPLFCSIIWRRYARSARLALLTHGENVHAVWLDDLHKDYSLMQELAEFLQIPNPEFFEHPDDQTEDNDAKTNTSFPSGHRPALSHADMFWMNLVASREMKQHGLSKTSSGFHPIAVLGSILKLPISTFHVIAIMSNRTGGSTITYLRRLALGR